MENETLISPNLNDQDDLIIKHITIKNKRATYVEDPEPIVCDNGNYAIEFTFDEEWNAYEKKKARFKVYNGLRYEHIDVEFSGNICPVPPLQDIKFVYVGVYVKNRISTSTPATIPCDVSILSGASRSMISLEECGRFNEVLKGESAYDLACDNGFEGTEAEWLASLRGKDGVDGKDGKDGADGKDGKDGLEGKSAYDIARDNGFEGSEEEWLASLKGDEWDYVITKVEDFTTENLATMSGSVLVKGIESYPSGIDAPVVKLPSGITLIKFVDSQLHVDVQATKGAKTKISGFVGSYAEPYGLGIYSSLRNFEGVEFCEGFPQLYDCTDIQSSTIHSAVRCNSISNVHCRANYTGGDYIAFTDCTILSNITFEDLDASMGSAYQVDFYRCKHLSNIHALSSDVIINYEDCSCVVGDTCDGYYTEENVGKVKQVTTNGEDSFVDVVEKVTTPATFRRVYAIDETGTQDVISIDNGYTSEEDVMEGGVAIRNENHSIYIPRPPIKDTDAVNKVYVDGLIGDIDTVLDNIIAKQKAVIGGEA